MRVYAATRDFLGTGSKVIVPLQVNRRVVGTMDVVVVESARVVVGTDRLSNRARRRSS